MLKVKQVGSVQVSPDGKRVAYVVREAAIEAEKSQFVSQIHVANADGTDGFALTQGETSSDAPQWSPDGRRIAFLSRRNDKAQVWIIRVDGGEAWRLSDSKGGVTAFRWSPDGRMLAIVATDGTPEEREARVKAKDDARVVDEQPRRARLYLLEASEDSKPGSGRLLTSGDLSILGDPGPGFDWSPDGRTIVFAHTPTADADAWTKSDISVVDVESGKVRSIAQSGRAESAPFYSPDGRAIAYVGSDDPPTWAFDSAIYLVPSQGGEAHRLADTFDHRPELLGWSAQGDRVFYRENRGTTTRLYSQSTLPSLVSVLLRVGRLHEAEPHLRKLIALQEKPARAAIWAYVFAEVLLAEGNPDKSHLALEKLPRDEEPLAVGPNDGVVGETALNATRTALGLSFQTTERPAEAYGLRTDGGGLQRVSNVNRGRPDLPLGRTEAVRWTSKDGREIEGLLTDPVGHEEGRKYPLLLIIHGGPAGVFTRTFIASAAVATSGSRFSTTTYPVAAFAARGYAVLRCNVRGSSGYGRDFRHANVKDWGGGDYEDLMAGVDHVVTRGLADPERLGVMGWSYGGYMTSWVLGHTKRFRAASVGAGVTDLVSFPGTADIASFLPSYFGGEPWERPETYREHSPITHVQGVTTPTLIQHGEDDERVPIGQGYELYNALKRQGCVVKMVVYPRAHHSIQEPKLLLDAMKRNLDWFDRHLKEKEPAADPRG
jgi:dipeptidyl aminopeptidase/acylaminoacyl peptidase